MTSDEIAAPPLPRTVSETGLSIDQIEQLSIKTRIAGELSGVTLADRVCLPYSMLEPLIERLRAERLVEVRGATGSGTAGYRYALTDLGRDRARQFLEINRYIGPAPVSLASYLTMMADVRQARGSIDLDRLQKGFSHLVVTDGLFDQLGPAIQLREGGIPLRAAGERQDDDRRRARARPRRRPLRAARDRRRGQIITMYDPICHEICDEEGVSSRLIAEAPRDRRWVRIRRPVIVVGGELTLEMLDLTFNPISSYHEAPLQLKANGECCSWTTSGGSGCGPRISSIAGLCRWRAESII